MIYEEIVERAATAAKTRLPQIDLDRLRVAVDVEFPTVLRDVSQIFAGTAKGDQLRQDVPLVFVAGFVTAPDKVLLKYLKHGRLFTSDPNAYFSHEREGTDISVLDKRLGYWKITGTIIEARTPTDGLGLDGAATLDAMCAPDTPALAGDPFTGPADMIPEFLDALVAKVAGTVRKVA